MCYTVSILRIIQGESLPTSESQMNIYNKDIVEEDDRFFSKLYFSKNYVNIFCFASLSSNLVKTPI